MTDFQLSFQLHDLLGVLILSIEVQKWEVALGKVSGKVVFHILWISSRMFSTQVFFHILWISSMIFSTQEVSSTADKYTEEVYPLPSSSSSLLSTSSSILL